MLQGYCTVKDGQDTCVCNEGYSGELCNKTVNCLDNPCAHMKHCEDQVGGYKCICQDGYKGQWYKQTVIKSFFSHLSCTFLSSANLNILPDIFHCLFTSSTVTFTSFSNLQLIGPAICQPVLRSCVRVLLLGLELYTVFLTAFIL